MSDPQNTQQNPETLQSESAVFLKELPKELLGKIRPEEWMTMGEGQKRETLVQHDLHQYLTVETAPAQAIEQTPVPAEAPVATVEAPIEGEVNVEELGKEVSEFEAAKDELKQVEQAPAVEEAPLNADEQARVGIEDGQNLKPQKKVKFFGYQPTPELVNNSEDVSANGDVSDGRTWAATFLRKLFAVFS